MARLIPYDVSLVEINALPGFPPRLLPWGGSYELRWIWLQVYGNIGLGRSWHLLGVIPSSPYQTWPETFMDIPWTCADWTAIEVDQAHVE